jgi:hypothetical protein
MMLVGFEPDSCMRRCRMAPHVAEGFDCHLKKLGAETVAASDVVDAVNIDGNARVFGKSRGVEV